MKTPTDEQINDACAEVCGWTWDEHEQFINRGEAMNRNAPDYCNGEDIRELLTALIPFADLTFERHIGEFALAAADYPFPNALCTAFHALRARPRLVAIAALLALKKWPDDWELPPTTRTPR